MPGLFLFGGLGATAPSFFVILFYAGVGPVKTCLYAGDISVSVFIGALFKAVVCAVVAVPAAVAVVEANVSVGRTAEVDGVLVRITAHLVCRCHSHTGNTCPTAVANLIVDVGVGITLVVDGDTVVINSIVNGF